MKTKILVLLCIVFHSFACKQEKAGNMNIITLSLEGKKYDELTLQARLEQAYDTTIKYVEYKGHSDDGYLWEFAYPASQYDSIFVFKIIVPNGADSNALERNVALLCIIDNDTLKSGDFFVSQPVSFIKGNYSHTINHPNLISDYFLADSHATDTEVFAKTGVFWSMISLYTAGDYDKYLADNISLAKKYPDSRFLLVSLLKHSYTFKSYEDISKVFACFSKKSRQSHYGQKIVELINTIFENSTLPAWDTGEPEPIIQDSSKYNLVMFSASWCGPCHRLIPLLKEINSNLSNKLQMTYISIDDSKTVAEWSKLMEKEEITWRALLAVDSLREIKEKYLVGSIPMMILVHPNTMQKEKISISRKEDLEKLYKLVNN
ncbi:MAG: thioredoxin family protein [Prevotellaceae bacterium]|jgi:thiol-disulfide isomerase/thioredoxin|nr:thioredoxin family protein [Prevotellaceae bacterium]